MEEITTENWYQQLVLDLKKLAFEGIVKTKWLIGKRILQDELKFGKPEYGSKRIENLAKDLDTNSRDLYRCMQFARQYPEIDTVCQNLSWRQIIKQLQEPRKKETETPALPEGKYNIIYADPPWQYWEGGRKNQSQHYSTMTFDEIAKIPVQELSADNCILFLWATKVILPEAIMLIKEWGFNYSTVGFVWVKSKKDGTGFAIGLGNWTRANAEYCLIGLKGTITRKDKTISEIIYLPKEQHSRKPAIVRKLITQLVGNLPRIELFATQKTKGWDSWGKGEL